MTTMLEKAARASAHAMHAFYNGDADSGLVWASLSEEAQESFKAQARAALQAIREPDEVMADAYVAAADDFWGPAAMHLQPEAFTAMIDAILSEGEA